MPASFEPAAARSPRVSIVLPTFNRARFLAGALDSIKSQQIMDWELIIVDDGSTDETEEVVEALTRGLDRPVIYHRQENSGPAAARNTGLARASGKYIAFFDSDDVWLPHHLTDCVAALEANASVDWVFGASRIVDEATGRVLAENSFYEQGNPRRFLALTTRNAGALRIIDDPQAILCSIEEGLYCGLQCSVFRKRMFESLQIPDFRVGEDRILPVIAMKQGCRLGYLDNVHVKYHVHDSNTSVSKGRSDVEHAVRTMQELFRAYEYLLTLPALSAREQRSVRRRLNREYFWHLGYAIYWMGGQRTDALKNLRRGLEYWPWTWKGWKTYLACLVRARLGHA